MKTNQALEPSEYFIKLNLSLNFEIYIISNSNRNPTLKLQIIYNITFLGLDSIHFIYHLPQVLTS